MSASDSLSSTYFLFRNQLIGGVLSFILLLFVAGMVVSYCLSSPFTEAIKAISAIHNFVFLQMTSAMYLLKICGSFRDKVCSIRSSWCASSLSIVIIMALLVSVFVSWAS